MCRCIYVRYLFMDVFETFCLLILVNNFIFVLYICEFVFVSASGCFLKQLFFSCNIPELYMMNNAENVASRRVKEKTGATFVKRIEFASLSGGKYSELWKLTREDWIAFRKNT